jgi:hypothetical protein
LIQNMMTKSFLLFCAFAFAARGVWINCPSVRGATEFSKLGGSPNPVSYGGQSSRHKYCDLKCSVQTSGSSSVVWNALVASYPLQSGTYYTVKCDVKCSSKPNGAGSWESRYCSRYGTSANSGTGTGTGTASQTTTKSISLSCGNIQGASYATKANAGLTTSPSWSQTGYTSCKLTCTVNNNAWDAENSNYQLISGASNRVDCKVVCDGGMAYKSCYTSGYAAKAFAAAASKRLPFIRRNRGHNSKARHYRSSRNSRGFGKTQAKRGFCASGQHICYSGIGRASCCNDA